MIFYRLLLAPLTSSLAFSGIPSHSRITAPPFLIAADLAALFRTYPTIFTLDPRHVAQRVLFLLAADHEDGPGQGQGQGVGEGVGGSMVRGDGKVNGNGDTFEVYGDTEDAEGQEEEDADEDEEGDDRPPPIAPPPLQRSMGYTKAQLTLFLRKNPRSVFYSERRFEALRAYFATRLALDNPLFCSVTSRHPRLINVSLNTTLAPKVAHLRDPTLWGLDDAAMRKVALQYPSVLT